MSAATERTAPSGTVYASSQIKRHRRTQAEILRLRDAMYAILEDEHPQTARHVFYRMVSLGLIQKTEAEYDNVVIRLLGRMREDGSLPFRWITDNTRWQIKEPSYGSLDAALRWTLNTYRRSLWDDQAVYVEIWVEKDAIAGFLSQVTNPWDVPLMVVRGFSSKSFLYSCARDIDAVGKPAYLYYFGDWDPSGVVFPQHIESSLRRYAPDAEIHFERIAVTPSQITDWDLPTRPTKKSDSRSKTFTGESVEVDAIPPGQLRDLAELAIRQHVDAGVLGRTNLIERSERAALQSIVAAWGGDA